MIKSERKLVKNYLEEFVLPSADLTKNSLIQSFGLSILSKDGKGILICPFCSSETSYFPGTSATRCNLCGTFSISTFISENAKSIFAIKNLSEMVNVKFDYKYFQTHPDIALKDVKDFLNAQLPDNFKQGLKFAGWTDDDISRSSIGSVGVDSEYLWERFIGYDHMDKYTDFCKYKGCFYMPFYDGDKINAVILPSDFVQNDIWSHIGYRFLYPPKFNKIWHAKSYYKSKVIAVSNPLYAIYLVVQGKPAIFVHGSKLKQNECKKHNIYIFEGDFNAKKLVGDEANIIPKSINEVDLSIWESLKSVDLNNMSTNWITELDKILMSGVSLRDAINTYEKENNMTLLVQPVGKSTHNPQ